jgi:hypothetical protein
MPRSYITGFGLNFSAFLRATILRTKAINVIVVSVMIIV